MVCQHLTARAAHASFPHKSNAGFPGYMASDELCEKPSDLQLGLTLLFSKRGDREGQFSERVQSMLAKREAETPRFFSGRSGRWESSELLLHRFEALRQLRHPNLCRCLAKKAWPECNGHCMSSSDTPSKPRRPDTHID